MGRVEDVVVEFLKADRACVLVSNEISFRDVVMIGKRNGLDANHLGNKQFEIPESDDVVHKVEYR